MFNEMMPMSMGGESEPYYKEYAYCFGRGGYGSCIGGKVGSASTDSNATHYLGEYLKADASGSYFYITVPSTVVGTIEVEYYSYSMGGTLTVNKGTFSAGDTITSIYFSATTNQTCFAGVLN